MRENSLPENRGNAYAMNHAIADGSGAWIAVLDTDDWYEPERLAVLVEAAELYRVPMAADKQRFDECRGTHRGRNSLSCR
jgi:glycosyltransferase involved in cell wall biosynthesis